MSGATSSPAKGPKTMSSKLLTMKFMQRAAASSPTSASSNPYENSPGNRSSGKSFNVDSLADQRAIQVALAAEETKRQAALARQAAAAGDTRWVLKFNQDVNGPHGQAKATLRVIQTGFSAIDNALPGELTNTHHEGWVSDRARSTGRKSFGKFTHTLVKSRDQDVKDHSDSSSDDDKQSEDDFHESDSDDPTSALIKSVREGASKSSKAERKAKKKAKKAESLGLAETRKKKVVHLNRLSSISGGGKESKACYRCGKEGHLKSECPQRVRDDDGDEPRAKKFKKSR